MGEGAKRVTTSVARLSPFTLLSLAMAYKFLFTLSDLALAGPIGGRAVRDVPIIPMGDEPGGSDAADGVVSPRPWQTGGALSSAGGGGMMLTRIADAAEGFLARAGFDRAPWLAVVFAGGILAWFVLPGAWQWCAAVGGGAVLALGALALWPLGSAADETRANLRLAAIACGLVFAAGITVIWARSEMIGAEPIARASVERLHGHVLEREDQPADQRLRLTLAVRDIETGTARKVRVNVPLAAFDDAGIPDGLAEGAIVSLRARLMPPASPMLPGIYDFARAAWFKGLAATGTMVGPLDILEPAPETGGIASLQRWLAAHVRARVDGSAGTIAAAFASGDRGSIAEADEVAMRDSGLTHLLSISGLHVSALIAAAYFAVIKPALALRVRLPVVAAAGGALAGVGARCAFAQDGGGGGRVRAPALAGNRDRPQLPDELFCSDCYYCSVDLRSGARVPCTA